MEKYTCPSCGTVFRGKRCRSCGYEHFSEQTGHRYHTQREEPLVTDAPVPKPIPAQKPLGRDKKTRKMHPLVRFLILLYLLYSLLPLLREWGLRLEMTEEANRSPASVHTGEVPHG